MNNIVFDKCPYCQSTNIGVGYQLGAGQVFADVYAYQSTRDCSSIEHLICKDCGSIIHSRAVKTDMFRQYGMARQEELGEYIEANGVLLCNENDDMPSLCSLGYSMENIIGMIELHQVFYCKAFKKRSTYLSARAYQLLNRCKTIKQLYSEAELVYKEIGKYDAADKDDIKQALGMDKKTFDKAFDFLLENLYITAFAGKRLNPSWYTYLYCTDKRFNKEVNGLHYNGDPKKALWILVGQVMKEKDFEAFCR